MRVERTAKLANAQCLPLCRASARYRGSGSSEPKGLNHSREAALLRTCQSCDVDSFRTPLFFLRKNFLPYPRFTRGRGEHCYTASTAHKLHCAFANFAVFSLFPHCHVASIIKVRKHTTSQPSVLNRLIPTYEKKLRKKQTKHLICGISDASSSFCTPVGSRTPIVGTGIRNSIH